MFLQAPSIAGLESQEDKSPAVRESAAELLRLLADSLPASEVLGRLGAVQALVSAAAAPPTGAPGRGRSTTGSASGSPRLSATAAAALRRLLEDCPANQRAFRDATGVQRLGPLLLVRALL